MSQEGLEISCVLTFNAAQSSIDSLEDSKGLTISSETLLLVASIDNDNTRLLSRPLGSNKAKSFSFLPMGLRYFNINILSKSHDYSFDACS